jgi:hypothetical protein
VLEANAIKPGQTIQSPNPQVTVTRLLDGLDAQLGQTVLGVPVLESEITRPQPRSGAEKKSDPRFQQEESALGGHLSPLSSIAEEISKRILGFFVRIFGPGFDSWLDRESSAPRGRKVPIAHGWNATLWCSALSICSARWPGCA